MFSSGNAAAQESAVSVAAAVPAQSPELTPKEDVVITSARFRDEVAQSVPVALSIFGGEELEATVTYNLGQLARLAPSLLFGQTTWHVTDAFSITPGIRSTWEKKDSRYDQVVSGGLATTNANLISRKNSIIRAQSYPASIDEGSASGQINASYRISLDTVIYADYAQGFKSGGLNMAGIPTTAAGLPAAPAAVVKPERSTTIEGDIKTQFFERLITANLALYHTDVKDYQANVVDTGPGALRGYLANVEKIRVKGVELRRRIWNPLARHRYRWRSLCRRRLFLSFVAISGRDDLEIHDSGSIRPPQPPRRHSSAVRMGRFRVGEERHRYEVHFSTVHCTGQFRSHRRYSGRSADIRNYTSRDVLNLGLLPPRQSMGDRSAGGGWWKI